MSQELELGYSDIEAAREAIKRASEATNTLAKSFDQLLNASEQAARGEKHVADAADDVQKKAHGAGGAFKQMLDSLGGIGGPAGEAASSLGDLAGKAEGIAALGAALGGGLATGAIAAAGAVLGLVGVYAGLSFADKISELNALATQYGLTASEASILSAAMEKQGIDIEEWTGAVDDLVDKLAASGDEGKKVSDAMKTLGISQEAAKNPTKVLEEASANLNKKLEEGSLTAAEHQAAVALLGEQWRNGVVAGVAMADATERANKFQAQGIAIHDGAAAAVKAHGKVTADLDFITQVLNSRLTADVLPTFSILKKALIDSYTNGGLVAGVFDSIRFATNLVMVPIKMLVGAFSALDGVVSVVGKAIGALFAAIATGSTEPLNALGEDAAAVAKSKFQEVKALFETGFSAGNGDGQVTKPNQQAFGGLRDKAGSAVVKEAEDDKEAKAKAEAAAKNQLDLMTKLRDLYQEQNYQAEKLNGVDVEREKLLDKARGILIQINGLTDEQRNSAANGIAALYDQNKQLDLQKKYAEDHVKLAKDLLDARSKIAAEEAKVAEAIARQKRDAGITDAGRFDKKDAVQQKLDKEHLGDAYKDRLRKIDEAYEIASKKIEEQYAKIEGQTLKFGVTSADEEAMRTLSDDQKDTNRFRLEDRKRAAEELANSMKELDSRFAELETRSQTFGEGFNGGLAQLTQGLGTYADNVQKTTVAIGSGFENMLTNSFVTGKFQIADFFKLLQRELASLAVKMLVIEPILAKFRSALGGSGGNTVGGFFSNLFSGAASGAAQGLINKGSSDSQNLTPMSAPSSEGAGTVKALSLGSSAQYQTAASAAPVFNITVGGNVSDPAATGAEIGQAASAAWIQQTARAEAQGVVSNELRYGGQIYQAMRA